MSRHKLVVGAHYGLRDWLAQRLTAVVMTVAAAVLAAAAAAYAPDSFWAWRDFVGLFWVRLLLLLFIFSLLWHAFIGGRDIFMDYIKWDGFRLFKVAGLVVYLVVCGLWALHILL